MEARGQRARLGSRSWFSVTGAQHDENKASGMGRSHVGPLGQEKRSHLTPWAAGRRRSFSAGVDTVRFCFRKITAVAAWRMHWRGRTWMISVIR